MQCVMLNKDGLSPSQPNVLFSISISMLMVMGGKNDRDRGGRM